MSCEPTKNMIFSMIIAYQCCRLSPRRQPGQWRGTRQVFPEIVKLGMTSLLKSIRDVRAARGMSSNPKCPKRAVDIFEPFHWAPHLVVYLL